MLGNTAIDLVSFIGETLKLIAAMTGLVIALRRWSTRGRSAKLAAFGFGTGILNVLLTTAAALVSAASAWTFYTPYSTTSFSEAPQINAIIVLKALASVTAVVSTLLLVAALWTAWRRPS